MAEILRLNPSFVIERHTPNVPIPTDIDIRARMVPIGIIAGIIVGVGVLIGAIFWHCSTGHWVKHLVIGKGGRPFWRNDWYALPGKGGEFGGSLVLAILGSPGLGIAAGMAAARLEKNRGAREIQRIHDSISVKKNELKAIGQRAQRESLDEREIDILLRSENEGLIAQLLPYLHHEELSLLKKKIGKEKFEQLIRHSTAIFFVKQPTTLARIAAIDPNALGTKEVVTKITAQVTPLLHNDQALCTALPEFSPEQLAILRLELGKAKLKMLNEKMLRLKNDKMAALEEQLQVLVDKKERLLHALGQRKQTLPAALRGFSTITGQTALKKRLSRLTEDEIYAQMNSFCNSDLDLLEHIVKDSLQQEREKWNAQYPRYLRVTLKPLILEEPALILREPGRVHAAGTPARAMFTAILANDEMCLLRFCNASLYPHTGAFSHDDIHTIADILGEQEMNRLSRLPQSTDIFNQINALRWHDSAASLITDLRTLDYAALERHPLAKLYFFKRAQYLSLSRRLLIAKIYFDKTAQYIEPEGFAEIHEEGTYTTLNKGDSCYSTRYNMQWRLFVLKPSDILFPNLADSAPSVNLSPDGTISFTNLIPHLPLQDQDRDGLLALLTFLNGPDREPTAAELPSLLHNAYKHLDRFADEALSLLVQREEAEPLVRGVH